MEYISKSPIETKEFATKIAQDLSPNTILLLEGDLGSGKTTFTRHLVKALNSQSRVQSPTFVIHRIYSATSKITKIHHLDLYRLQDERDLLDLELEELQKEKNAIVIIEWPQIAQKITKNLNQVVKIKFEYIDENTRKIQVHSQN